MAQIIGIALWALIPGFVAKKKGRNFWGWYFLSFVISPLITTIITFCLSNVSENKDIEVASSGSEEVGFCRKCGEPLIKSSKFCRKCGTEVLVEIDNTIPLQKCEMCDKQTDHLTYCEIKDELGTRYRNICNECMLKYGAKEKENDLQ